MSPAGCEIGAWFLRLRQGRTLRALLARRRKSLTGPLDQGLDVFDTPRREPRAEFDRLRIAAGSDPRPPRAAADGDGAARTDDGAGRRKPLSATGGLWLVLASARSPAPVIAAPDAQASGACD